MFCGVARWKKVKFGPRLGPRLYLGPNDFIIDFGRPFDADSGNVGQKNLLCAVWPLGGFKVGLFQTKKGCHFAYNWRIAVLFVSKGFSRPALPIKDFLERPQACEPPQIAKKWFYGWFFSICSKTYPKFWMPLSSRIATENTYRLRYVSKKSLVPFSRKVKKCPNTGHQLWCWYGHKMASKTICSLAKNVRNGKLRGAPEQNFHGRGHWTDLGFSVARCAN